MIYKLVALLFVCGTFADTVAQGATQGGQDMQSLLANAEVRTENVTVKPRIITQRISAKPRVITERVVGQPRIVTEQVIEPTRQKIVIQPSITRIREELTPQFQKQEDRLVNRGPVTRPTQFKQRQVTKNVQVEGD